MTRIPSRLHLCRLNACGLLAWCLAVLLVPGQKSQAQGTSVAPILWYQFNEPDYTADSTGETAVNSGSAASANATLRNSSGTATNYHGAAGSGVSGQSADLAFNGTSTTAVTGPPAGDLGPAATAPSASINSLESFTLAGWFYNTSGAAIGNAVRLFDNSYNNATFLLDGNGSSELGLSVNNSTAASTASYGAFGSWVYFAVSYDGTSTTSNVKFYEGTTTSAATLVDTVTLNKGTVAASTGSTLYIGNTGSYLRGFQGYLDNMAIFGSTTSNTGALSLADVEAFQSATEAPEPAAGVVLVLGGVIALLRYRRNQAAC